MAIATDVKAIDATGAGIAEHSAQFAGVRSDRVYCDCLLHLLELRIKCKLKGFFKIGKMWSTNCPVLTNRLLFDDLTFKFVIFFKFVKFVKCIKLVFAKIRPIFNKR
jgi:hypothetical protein